MNRIDRLTAILIQLQTKKVTKAQEIADRFGISLRTVYRDVRALEEAGVPIGAEAGVGYFLMEGYHLPPVMFSKEEAGALLTGEKLLEKMADKSVGRHFSEAMRKIRAVLRTREKEYLESLEAGIVVHRVSAPGQEGFPNHFLSNIQQAVAERKVLEMEYFSNYKEEVSRRQVEPLGVCYLGTRWHMVAWCRLRHAIREFRIDRIRNMQVLAVSFGRREENFLQHYVERMTRPRNVHKVVLRCDRQVARFLGEQKFYYGVVDEQPDGDRLRMTFLTGCLQYFGRWLLSWGTAAEVLEPEALQTQMAQLSEDLFLHYQADKLEGLKVEKLEG
ncbi:MAG TPA: YafY family protein [Cytophagales bacterium]|jgi:predicted DNA-binding transcriptional regulator YafY